MSAAARVSDPHACPRADPRPHRGGPILPMGEPTVLIGQQPAARVGDPAACDVSVDRIAKGASNVRIGGHEAARAGDPTIHGGRIVAGDGSVLLGLPWQAELLVEAAAHGAMHCPVCHLDMLPAPPAPLPPLAFALERAAIRGDAYCEVGHE